MTTPLSARMLRELHTYRLQRRLISDANSFVQPLAAWADRVRANRRAAGDDNPFVQAEMERGSVIERALDGLRDTRDRMPEAAFEAIWTNPSVRARVGAEAPFADFKKPRAVKHAETPAWIDLKLQLIKQRGAAGGLEQALIRIMRAGVAAAAGSDARGLRAARKVWTREGVFDGVSRPKLLEIVEEEAFLLQFDRACAMTTLPALLPTRAERERAGAIARELASRHPTMLSEIEQVLAEVEEILDLRNAGGTADAARPDAAE